LVVSGHSLPDEQLFRESEREKAASAVSAARVGEESNNVWSREGSFGVRRMDWWEGVRVPGDGLWSALVPGASRERPTCV